MWIGKVSEQKWGDLLTMEQWISYVRSGMLINYDGYGNYVMGDSIIHGWDVYPSQLKKNEVFTQTYSHIMWYNR